MAGRIPYFREGTRASASHLNQLVDAANALQSLTGDGYVTVSGPAIGLNLGLLAQRMGRSESWFVAKLTGNATDGDNKWKYAWTEVRPSAAGYGNWGAFTDCRTGSTGTNPARNLLEDMNAATGTQGNGVDVANLDDGSTYSFAMKAIPTNALVIMYTVRNTDDTVGYWFAVPNGVDGTCD